MNIWLTILEKYGIAITALVVLVLFVWRGMWPFLVKQIEESRRLLEEHAQTASDRLQESTKDFTEALKRRDEQTERIFDKMVSRLDRIDDNTRRK